MLVVLLWLVWAAALMDGGGLGGDSGLTRRNSCVCVRLRSFSSLKWKKYELESVGITSHHRQGKAKKHSLATQHNT